MPRSSPMRRRQAGQALGGPSDCDRRPPLAVTTKAFSLPELKRLIEQAMRDETGSDFAWMNQGGVRDALPAGQLLERHIWDMMPFENRVVVGTFKGRDLPAVVVAGRTIDPIATTLWR